MLQAAVKSASKPANSLPCARPTAVQMLRHYGRGIGGGRGGRLGAFSVSHSSVFHELSNRVFFLLRGLFCVCIVSPSRPLCRIIPFMSSLHCQWRKNKKKKCFFFSSSDSHIIRILLHPFIRMRDNTLGTAAMGLQDSGFCERHLLQSTWFHFTPVFFVCVTGTLFIFFYFPVATKKPWTCSSVAPINSTCINEAF